jgi:hypothetical protein
MILGFTGTQLGMTWFQIQTILDMFRYQDKFTAVHHGDCLGADQQMHHLALLAGLKVVIHPPQDPRKRAYCSGANVTVLDAFPYLIRNHDIVDACHELVATPKTHVEELRSGTWATIRYARKVGKPVHIIEP